MVEDGGDGVPESEVVMVDVGIEFTLDLVAADEVGDAERCDELMILLATEVITDSVIFVGLLVYVVCAIKK